MKMRRSLWTPLAALALIAGGTLPAAAQVKTVDPNQAIDSDITPPDQQAGPPAATPPTTVPPPVTAPAPAPTYPQAAPAPAPAPTAPVGTDEAQRNRATESADTYNRDDLLSAAEGVFGKGAEGLAGLLEKILHDQGRPNAYIAGREASGAFVVGLRYGSGILNSKIEGQQPVYWTGPSVGFDVGGDANKVFVLVYNLYDSEELFKRFPAGEGHLYFVGGFSASYLRSGNVVLIPVRLGVGWRAGVNVGYMKFSHHEKWLPF
jgi:hypothetical protein